MDAHNNPVIVTLIDFVSVHVLILQDIYHLYTTTQVQGGYVLRYKVCIKEVLLKRRYTIGNFGKNAFTGFLISLNQDR